MRRVKILFAATSILCCIPLFSDSLPESPSYKHELQFKLGPAPGIPLALSIFAFSYNQVIVPENIMFLAIPAFTVEYLYNLTPRHAIGASVNTFLGLFPTAMFKYRLTYRQTKTVRMYGAVGLGLGGYHLYPYPAIQLTPFGMQIGGKRGFFLMETGLGMEGSLLILGGGFRL